MQKMRAKNKTIKFISIFLLIAILVPAVLFSRPEQAEAFWWSSWVSDVETGATAITTGTSAVANTTSTVIAVKNVAKEIGKQILMHIASKLLQDMTKSTINWINTGYYNNPLFLENPDSFFRDIAKYEIRNIVDAFGYDLARFPFGKDFALNTINSYKRQLADNAQYSLSKVITDPILLKKYQTDFNVGGWNGFLINTQYPQNNYLGFQMIATEELGRKLQGLTQTAGQKIQTTLAQSQGFLSPQTCPSNPKYNNTKNQFLQPKWNEADYERTQPPPDCFNDPKYVDDTDSQLCEADIIEWQAFRDSAKAEWTKDNTCPGGLVTTTPGSVVGNKIMTALGSGQRLTELGATMGNSISALVDALLNKFIGKGLNSLTSRTNPPTSTEDDWSYDGQTLGSPAGPNATWDAGPDQEIILSGFKKQINGYDIGTCSDIQNSPDQKDVPEAQCDDEKGSWVKTDHVPGDIENTEAELQLISNDDPDKPGVTQMFGSIWPKTRELDMCVPGPDILWQARADSEMQRNSNLLSEKINDDDPKKATSATIALKDLKFAVNFFKDWINNKMMTTLPKSVIYMDAVDEIETLYQESDELIDARRLKTQAVSRLEAIKSGLDSIAEQPEPGSGEEKVLIKLKQQYDATRDTISNTATINNRKNQLNIAIDKYKKLNELIPECQQQRTEKGWTNPGGRKSTYLDKGTEQNLFCDFPIKGGYSHNSFIGPDTIVPKVPMVNGKDVMNWPRFFGLFGTKRVNIEMNCDLIYKANVLDYKGSLPGLTPITEDFEDLTGDFGGGGEQCDETGEQYAGALRDAMDAVLAENPSVGDLPNIESGGRQNARTFLALVETELISRGFNATDEVLNGNNNPSTGDIIAVWMDGDTMMERYDAIIGSASTIREAATTQFTGFIPLNCTASGGGTDCGCSTGGGGTEPPTDPVCTPPQVLQNHICVTLPPTPTDGTPYISSITPATATAGTTTITINGTNLSTINKPSDKVTIRFYYGLSGRASVDGTVNSAKTQATVLVPAEINTTNTTIKIYRDGSTESNPYQIQISNSGSGGGTTVPSYNATGGWGGNLAYNPAQNNWLVVSGGVNGRIMGNTGTAITSEFQIQTTAASVQVMAPKVAFASDINKYLVVWIGFPDASGGTIYGRFVNPDGSMSGAPFVIFKDPGGAASFFSKNSVLQYDSQNKQFAFVWEYRHPGVDSNLITISQSGVVGTAIDVGSGTGSWVPVLAMNETANANEYCIAYVRDNGTTNVTRKYNPATGALGAETVYDNDSLGVTSIVYNSVNKKYMISWPSKSSTTTKGRILNSCNIADGGSVLTISSAGRGGALAYNSKSNNYAVIVQNQNDSGNTYNILSSTGTQLKSGVAFFGGFGNFSPVIAANTNDGSFAATSSLEYSTTRFAPGLKSGSSSGGTPGVITPATPISTWSPAQTSNGWWAKISPDGKYVTYGNWGESWVTDLNTGQNYDFKAPANLPAGARCLAGQWITTTKLTFICEIGTIQNPTGMIRYEATIGEWVARLTTDSPALAWATTFAAKDGHWASYLAANPRRIAKDNAVLTTNGPGGALSISGNTLVHACDGSDNPDICVWTGSTLSKTIIPLSSVSETATNSGYILYAGGGTTMRGIDPNGNDTNKKIGSFSFEGKPVVFLVRGAPWIATSVESNTTNKSYVILRPWSSKNAIVLDTGTPNSGSAGIDAVFDGTNFVVAQHTNKGILKVIKVPENATRSQF